MSHLLSRSTPANRYSLSARLFHEAGHAWHGLLSKVQFAKFAGTSVARDFGERASFPFATLSRRLTFTGATVEAPSQMLENWMWEPKVLKSLSKHYKTGEQLDDQTIDALVKSRNVNQGLFNTRQLFFAKFDSESRRAQCRCPELSDWSDGPHRAVLVHTSQVEADQTKLWNDLREQTSLVNTDGEYIPGQSGFAHITGGYSAG